MNSEVQVGKEPWALLVLQEKEMFDDIAPQWQHLVTVWQPGFSPASHFFPIYQHKGSSQSPFATDWLGVNLPP